MDFHLRAECGSGEQSARGIHFVFSSSIALSPDFHHNQLGTQLFTLLAGIVVFVTIIRVSSR
jgi:hypothetical protein